MKLDDFALKLICSHLKSLKIKIKHSHSGGENNLAFSSTLSDSMNAQFRLVIPAGIAGIQAPWMDFSLPSLALDPRSRRG
jgi:hypothetical protein